VINVVYVVCCLKCFLKHNIPGSGPISVIVYEGGGGGRGYTVLGELHVSLLTTGVVHNLVLSSEFVKYDEKSKTFEDT
jgi:hypothetical protein